MNIVNMKKAQMARQHVLGNAMDTDDLKSYNTIINDYIKNDNIAGIIIGRVTKIENNKVYLDVNKKYEGVVSLSEFRVNGEITPPAVGEDIQVWNYGDAASSLSREVAVRYIMWPMLVKSYNAQKEIMGKILSEDKGARRFNVDISGIKAILPFSQFEAVHGGGHRHFIGTDKPMTITELKTFKDPILLACKVEKDSASCSDGQPVDGVITEVLYNGAIMSFKNAAGESVSGWLSISDNTDSKSLSEVFHVGQEIRATIEKIQDNGKICLKYEKVPWETVKAKFQKNTTWQGKISTINDSGIVIVLPDNENSYNPGVRGVISIDSQGTDTWGIKRPALKEFFPRGSTIEVKVKPDDFNNDRHEIPLTICNTSSNPWKDVNLKVGDVTECEVNTAFNNRAFLKINTYIDGLLKFNQYQLWNLPKPKDKIKVTVSDFNIEEGKLHFIMGAQDLAKQDELMSKLSTGNQIEVEILQVVESGYGSYGLYVRYQDTIDGFVKKDSISRTKKLSEYTVGEKISAVIESIEHQDRILLLSIFGSEKRTWRENKLENKGVTFGEIMSNK